MSTAPQYELVESIMSKSAQEKKADIGDYRPWNMGDAKGVAPTTAGIGAGLGGLAGLGSAAWHNLTRDDDEEEASYLGRGLGGAGLGGIVGGVAPIAGALTRGPLSSLAGWGSELGAKQNMNDSKWTGWLPDGVKDVVAGGAGSAVGGVTNALLPHMSLEDLAFLVEQGVRR